MERYGRQREAKTRRRGDPGKVAEVAGRRVSLSRIRWSFDLSAACRSKLSGQDGFTLIELVMTITVMTILTLGVIPLIKVSVKRQKEQQLRDSLRQMRIAIDEFRRDTVGMVCAGTGAPPTQQQQPPIVNIDPRSKVVVSDCTLFGVDNPDRYPPDLETLVNGVNVVPRGGGLGRRGDAGTTALEAAQSDALSTKKKVYLRAIPIDPITGKAEWELRSCYDAADAGSWGRENVFDVRSTSSETALNGEKYSDW